jgi:hypothetical protein
VGREWDSDSFRAACYVSTASELSLLTASQATAEWKCSNNPDGKVVDTRKKGLFNFHVLNCSRFGVSSNKCKCRTFVLEVYIDTTGCIWMWCLMNVNRLITKVTQFEVIILQNVWSCRTQHIWALGQHYNRCTDLDIAGINHDSEHIHVLWCR